MGSPERPHRARFGVVLATAIGIGLLPACLEDAPRPRFVELDALREPTGLRLLILGIDGATWEILDPMLASGELPNLAELLRRGARGTLEPVRSSDPELGWIQVLTGRPLVSAGIENALLEDPHLGRKRFAKAGDRWAPALWEVLEAAGLRVLVAGFDLTWPADPEGVFVASEFTGDLVLQALGASRRGPLVVPRDLEPELRDLVVGGEDLEDAELAELGPLPPDFMAESRAAVPLVGHAPSYLRHAWANQRNVERVVLHLMAKEPFDVVAVELDGLAATHAMLQHLVPGEFPNLPADPRLGEVLREIQRRDDRLLGRLLGELGRDTVVAVVAAYGYGVSEHADLVERPVGDLRPAFSREAPPALHFTPSGSPSAGGVFLLAGPPVRPGVVDATPFDVLPTLAALLGLPAARDLPGRILGEALDPLFLRDRDAPAVDSYEPFLRTSYSPSERR